MTVRFKRAAYTMGVAGACALAIALRWRALAPSYLWLDDQWIAVLVRDASLRELLALAPPVPFGFVLLLKGIVYVVGDSALALQIMPFIAGLLLVPASAALAMAITSSRAAALTTAIFVAANPLLGTYSVRVKPFALDALATVIIAWAFVVAMHRPSVRTLAGIGIAGAASLLVSVAALIPGAVFVHTAAALALFTVMRERDATSAPRLRSALYGCALFDFVAFAVLSFGLRSQSNSTIFDYWQKCYLPLDSFHAAREFLASKGVVVFADAVPGMPPRATMLLAAIGCAALVVRRPTRTAGMCIGAVFLALFTASALQYYPAGGVRTDLFTHPLTALLAATAIHAMASTRRSVGRIARPLLIVIVSAGAFFASSVATYPRAGDREVIEHAAVTLGDDDTVFIYPWTNWAVALYGRWPVTLEAEPASTNGFYAIPVRAHTMVLRERRGDMSFRATADVARPQIEGYLASEPSARVHLIATRVEEHALGYIRDAIEARGYRRTETFERYRATFDTFERHAPLDAVARREALTPGAGGARSRPIVE